MKPNPKYLGFLTGLFIVVQLMQDYAIYELFTIIPQFKTNDDIGIPLCLLSLPVIVFLSNILPEVYGYANSKKVLVKVMKWVVSIEFFIFFFTLFYASYDTENFQSITIFSARLLLGNWIAFFASEICKFAIMDTIEAPRKGKLLWLRAIGSTLVSRLIYVFIIYIFVFLGSGVDAEGEHLFTLVFLLIWLFKVCEEVFYLPFTYLIVNSIKRKVILDVDDCEEEMPVLVQE
jgi:uncharacterized integral membrane protein (TIGR00697 family)